MKTIYKHKNFSLKVIFIFHFLLFTFHLPLFTFHLNAQTLNEYVKIARINNSNLKVKTANYELAKEKVNEVGTYQNTNINLGVFALTPETRVGSQLFRVGASQKLPWFGEFTAQKNAVKAKAEIKQYDIVLSERNLDFQVKKAYFEIYKQQVITAILKDNKLILKTYESMALAALSNSRATMSDVLRIRVQTNELHSKIFQNINSIKTLSKNFNKLLQRENKALNVVDSLNVLDILVKNQTINNHPSIAKILEMNKVYDAREKLIDIDKKPKITVGLDYILVDGYNDLNPNQNGKDILMPKVSVGIPIFNKKFSSQYKQIKIQEEILKDEIENQKNNLNIALDQSKLEIDNAILSVIAAQKNKTEIQRAINVDLKAYETGILDYDKILRLQLQKIKFQLAEIEAIKKAYIAKAKVEYLVE
ncbi:MAG: TolC family protein [Flavobacteriaceae bacterium]|nr:TolC family protein [Flavobacteriaceae bacterium]